jgi:hypothetical protein
VCPQDFFTPSHRQPSQIACLPEGRAPKDRGLPSPHSGWIIAAKTSILVKFIRDRLGLSGAEAISLAG